MNGNIVALFGRRPGFFHLSRLPGRLAGGARARLGDQLGGPWGRWGGEAVRGLEEHLLQRAGQVAAPDQGCPEAVCG